MNGSRFTFKMNLARLVLFIFCWCIWTVTCYSSQVDNDLVYDKRENSSPLLSSQNTHHREKNKVEVGQNVLLTVSDDAAPKDRFFERINEHWHRFKRNLLGNVWHESIISSSTEDNFEKSDDVPKRGDDIVNSNYEGVNIDEDDNEDEEGEDDQIFNTTVSNGFYSGDGSITTETMTIEMNYYRAFIILLTPFNADLENRTSSKYIEFSNNISAAIKDILNDQNFVNLTVVGITQTKDPKESKVLVDLGMTNYWESSEKIRNRLYAHLTVYHKLNSVVAVPERLEVWDFKDHLALTCNLNEFSCAKGTYCYPINGRCNNYTQCPDKSDELDCPGWSDSTVKALEDKCRGDNKYHCPLGVFTICYGEVCNGIKDCFFGEDEAEDYCGKQSKCKEDEIMCDNRCLPANVQCDTDNKLDCNDGRDGKNCTDNADPSRNKILLPSYFSSRVSSIRERRNCTADEFQCKRDGWCIDKRKVCDLDSDCGDHSDEMNCPNQFECEDKSLRIPLSLKCDGKVQCADQSDENNCTSTKQTPSPTTTVVPTEPTSIVPCRVDQFSCYDGACMNASKRCNNVVDCKQGEDEEGCCINGFQCRDGPCIHLSKKCDGSPDCLDYSDEQNCSCTKNQFQCADGHCILLQKFCDKIIDCFDGSDEQNCTNNAGCLPDEFKCADQHCIPSIRRCDGRPDCRDNSDEIECCSANEFQCKTHHHCIPLDRKCDKFPDCRDGSDESETLCRTQNLKLRTYPNNQVRLEGDDVDFLCRDESSSGIRANITWERGGNLPLPRGSLITTEEGRLHMSRIQKNQAGEYICKTIGGFSETQTSVSLIVEERVVIRPTASPLICNEDQSTCNNGQCIAKNLLCDGKHDCIDGSDEFHCNECEPDEFRCANNRCMQITYLCDGENDCGDGSDEQPENCETNSWEFSCFNGSLSIPKSFHCDFSPDCADGSDEIGCSKCMIIQNPPRSVELPVGAKFSIACKAVGIPVPEIVFRHNWKHVPSQCKTTNLDGIGRLTCPYVESRDGGAYSCECISNRGRTFGTDTILTVTGEPGKKEQCQPGQFNSLANTTNDCTSCFCFGVTSECQSAKLFTYQPQSRLFPIRIVNVFESQMNLKSIDLNPLQSSIQKLDSNSFTIQGNNKNPNAKSILYFALPESFLGNQLKSYGGYIKYRVRYEGSGHLLNSSCIILSGNGYLLLHWCAGSPLQSGQEKQESIRILYGSWFKLNRGLPILQSEYFPKILASRQEIMMTLAKLDNILLKGQFVESKKIDTTISNFKFDSAGPVDSGQGEAAYVEECRCPDGYFGLSCENCAPGYQRVLAGPWLGHCRRTRESCEEGSYGDPSQSCYPCPCPFTAPPNKFSPTCFLDTDGQPTCNACPIGYSGRRCEICSQGFVGNPLIPGSSCQGTLCDSAGSQSLTVDAATGQCRCKENVDGPFCNKCKPNAFYLSPTNVFGCIKCFCMGVTSECFSSRLYRDQIVAAFVRDNQDLKIGGRWEVETFANRNGNINLDPIRREITFSDFQSNNEGAYYWSLPQKFLGNKVKSYGGVLNYTLRYTPTPGGQFSKNNAPDVEIISEKNSIHLFYFERETVVEPNVPQTLSVRFLEQYWQRTDGQIANREHLLMALADLKTILIKATYTTSTQLVALQNVVLETAEDRNTGLQRAYEVEECRCPPGYRGTSCEECDVGYHKVDDGLYLGLCKPCNCHGHSRDCDADTGICVNCVNHTMGENCEQCEPGYVGNPSTGESCEPEGPCRCDPRGSLSTECRNGQCVCKGNVFGSTCGTCRRGTFDLQTSHEFGCLECYCSGATNECQSSNLFVTQIPMPILDDEHGFTLTTIDRSSKIVKSGFKLNVAQNQIGYDYTTERGLQLFWSLPPAFTGNKITSYGGSLTWTQIFTAPADAIPRDDNDIVLYGDGIKIVWNNNFPIAANTNVTMSVKLHEEGFHRLTPSGTSKATRADIMRILSSIEAILIRATYASQTSFVFISDVSLDTAVSQPFSNIRATQVEACACPLGYRGYSCESCIPGYYQVASPYGKECRKCPCKDHEESCFLNADTSITCNCLPGYTGTYCEGKSFYLSTGVKPLNVYEPIGTTVNVTCVYESSDKLTLQFIKNFTRFLSVPINDTGEPTRDKGNWKREKNFAFVVEPSLRSVYCQVVNENGIISGTVHAQIQPVASSTLEPPTILPTIVVNISEPLIQIVAIGSTVRINCKAESIHRKPVTVKWSREGAPLPPGRAIDDGYGYFFIINAIVSDSGTYVCEAYDGESYVRRNVSVQVEDSSTPKVIITPETPNNVLEFNIGDAVAINCEATGIPPPVLEWFKESDSPLYRKTGNRSVSFRITAVSKANQGTYVCRARNNVGSSYKRVNVIVRDGSSQIPSDEQVVRVSVSPSEFNGLAGESVRLDCTSAPPNNHILKWARVDNAPLPRTAVDRDGVLIIHNADSGTSGVYVCNAVSVLTNNIISHAFVNVNIGESEQILQVPVLSIDPERQTVPQGSLVVIRCTSPNDPRATVKWRKANDEFTSHVQIMGNEIRIQSAMVKDRGVYVCESENAAGAARVSSALEVDRREPPVIEIYPQTTQTIEIGGSTFIQCRILKGIPAPKMRWLRRGQQTFSPHVTEIGPALRFTDVDEEDGGEYTCSAENAAGSVDAIAALEIISRPVITVLPADRVYVDVGKPIRLECTATGKPTPSISWQNGYQTDPKRLTPGTAIFEITRAQLSDTDIYTCSATNIAGRSEERVQVFVVDTTSPDRIPPPPLASISPVEETVFPLRTDASIRCFYDSSNALNENIFFKWEREDHTPFSSRVEERRNTLVIHQVEREDSGRYTCVGIDAITGQELFSKTFSLRVIAPPNITLYPIHQVVRPGDNAHITCSATGDQPISIYWSTTTGEPLPRSASVDKGVLRFRGITFSDAGKYVCRAQNYVGEAESPAEVRVNQIARPASPVITAEDHYKTAIENSDMDLRCTVNSATSDYQITWSRDRSELPRTSRIVGNTLRLFRLQPEDSDRYICNLTSPYGVSMDYIDLQVARTCLTNEFRCSDGTCIPDSQYCDTVQHCADNTDEIDCHKHTRGVNNVTIEIESSLNEAKVGDTLHLTCKANGDASARIVWTKADGAFESNVETSGEILRISNMQIKNVGVYRCSAHTKDGFKLNDYNLNIELPSSTGDIYTIANVTKKSVKNGHNIELVCDTDLDPPVNYSWIVHSYEKSLRKIVPNTRTLSIMDASANNSGIYFCNAVSSRATFSLPTVLTVDNVIPAFAGNSYLTLPPIMVHSTYRSEIEINFKPKSYNGLILFNAQRKDTKGDFISFGLNNGVPEFRYDVGSGPAIIRGDSQLTLNKWHKVVLSRNTKHGFMEINGMSNFTGSSPGKFETLDLQLPLYVGGHFNYSYVSGFTELNTGFKGCINRLRIDSKEINLKKEPQEAENVESCNNCDQNPCLNHGFCQETASSFGYICICRPGYSGEICQLRKDTCYLDSCGSGQCLENEDGIECLCPFSKTGQRCQKRIDINVPAFKKNSYLAYAAPFLKKKLKLLLKLKPVGEPEVDNGIILYVAESDNGKDDFIALSIINSFVELRFKVMGRSVNLTSNHYLIPGEYVNISLSMDSSELIYSVAGESQIKLVFNPTGSNNDLRLHTSLYVGGYDKKSILLPEEMSVRSGFHGCISMIELSGIDLGILQSYVEAINVNDCFSSFGDICETTLPCKNGGKCLTSRNSYKCDCQSNFGGVNCERQKDMCEILNPCKNNGKCVGFTGSFKCYCGLGFSGDRCDDITTLEKSVSFDGDGYVELYYTAVDEIIHISFTTNHLNGLLYWHGQHESINGAKHDFIAIAIQNGFVRLAYQANSSGVKSISATDRRVNDGETHSITVRRVKTQISIELDSKTTDLGEIPETLNTSGNIYIGGLPDVRFMTGNLYSDNFNGCIQQLRINNPVINFGQTAISARNAVPCSNPSDDNTV